MANSKSLITRTQEEIKELRTKIGRQREYLDILEMELFNTRAYLQEFTDVYSQHIGPLEAELNRLVDILEAETAYDAPPDPDARFGPKADTGKKEGAKPQGGKGAHTRRQVVEDARDADYERKIRELFRNLAKRFHPDLAGDETDREKREKIMAQVNNAYASRDLKALQSLAQMAKVSKNGGSRSPQAELLRLKMELSDLEAMVFEVEHTIRELDNSPAMQMRTEYKIETQAGRDMLADLKESYQMRISELREHLIDLGVEPEVVKA